MPVEGLLGQVVERVNELASLQERRKRELVRVIAAASAGVPDPLAYERGRIGPRIAT